MSRTGAKDLFAALQEKVPQERQPALLPLQSFVLQTPCRGPAKVAAWGFCRAWWFPEHPGDAFAEWQKILSSSVTDRCLLPDTPLLAPARLDLNLAMQE